MKSAFTTIRVPAGRIPLWVIAAAVAPVVIANSKPLMRRLGQGLVKLGESLQKESEKHSKPEEATKVDAGDAPESAGGAENTEPPSHASDTEEPAHAPESEGGTHEVSVAPSPDTDESPAPNPDPNAASITPGETTMMDGEPSTPTGEGFVQEDRPG